MKIWKHFQRVQQELKTGTCDTQDTAIAALHDHLDRSPALVYPSFLYPLLIELLTFYGRTILPSLGISEGDQRIVRAVFAQTIARLQTQDQAAKALENTLKQFFLNVKSGSFTTGAAVVAALITILGEADVLDPPFFDTPFDRFRIPPERGQGWSSPPDKTLEKRYRILNLSPFTTAHVLPFFELLSANLPDNGNAAFAQIHDLFWHQLNDLLHMKVVLVNTNTRAALITRLDVTTTLESQGLDMLDFENTVDDRMERSCWHAVQAARAFLADRFPDSLNNYALHVTCQFPNPAAEYNDTSASLLVGLKIVGDVLDLEIDPHTLVSGEVDASGQVLPVTCLAEKILAAQQHPNIHQMLLPAAGLFMTSRRVTITGIHDLSEAVVCYYGNQFQKKYKQSTRNQLIRHVTTGLLAAPAKLSLYRNIFTHPLKEQDVWSVEYARELYQRAGEYQQAIHIFQTVVREYARQHSSAEILELKAKALGYLGVIYTQQHAMEKSLSVLQHARAIWQTFQDRDQYVKTLFRIGDVYRYAWMSHRNKSFWRTSLDFYQQAYHLLSPSMPQFRRLHARYDRLSGYLYYGIADYGRAEEHSRNSMTWTEAQETEDDQWNYQTVKQLLGRILLRQGAYDDAYDLLESTAQAPLLQTPHNQARSFWTLCDFFLARKDIDKGLEFAVKSEQLCRKHHLTAEQQILTNLLARYHVLPERNDHV